MYTIIKTTRLSVVSVTVAAALAGWPVTGGVVEVGVASHPGADAERYTCACLHCTQGLAGRGGKYQCGLDWGLSNVSVTDASRRLLLACPGGLDASDVDVTVVCTRVIVLVVSVAAQHVHVEARTAHVAPPDRLIRRSRNDLVAFPVVRTHDEAHHLTGNRRVCYRPALKAK